MSLGLAHAALEPSQVLLEGNRRRCVETDERAHRVHARCRDPTLLPP